MEKNDVQRLLERHKGSIRLAAEAAGVEQPRFRVWAAHPDKITDDGYLRCWLALHPQGRRLLMEYRHERDRRTMRGAA